MRKEDAVFELLPQRQELMYDKLAKRTIDKVNIRITEKLKYRKSENMQIGS